MKTLWAKDGQTSVDARIMAFMAADDVILDRALFRWDILASVAHVKGLERIEILSADESSQLVSQLQALGDAFASGEFVLDEQFEDGHSAIEAFLTTKLGDVGAKVHTGRSRNDQVLVASRLFLRDSLATLGEMCLRAAAAFLTRAEAEMQTPMPGYTHLQRAVPSTVGMWMAAFAEAFVDNHVGG